MKYAKEVMDLLSSDGEKDFRMVDIVSYITGDNNYDLEKRKVRVGVRRVMSYLSESGCVNVKKMGPRGSYATYSWVD